MTNESGRERRGVRGGREGERGDRAGQGDWHLNSTELPQSASDPVITTSV